MKRLYVPVALALGLALASCSQGNGNPPPPPPGGTSVASITITADKTVLAPGGTANLSASAKDTAGASVSPTYTWTSSSNSVATVSNGVVTAVGTGSANITASAGGVTSNAIQITVAPVVQAGSYLAAQNWSSKPSVNGWLGGEDIHVKPAGALTNVTFDVIGMGATFSGTATPGTPFIIAKSTYGGTYPNVTLRAKTANGAPVNPATADLAIKVDNQPPSLQWTSTQYGVECVANYNYAGSPLYTHPGTLLNWTYTATDSGSGVGSARHHTLIDRELNDNAKPGGEYPFWTEDAKSPNAAPGNVASYDGTFTFWTLGGAKTHAVQLIDGLGNATAVDNGSLPACNDYKDPRTGLNGRAVNPSFGHTMPAIGGASIPATVTAGSTVTVSATGVFGSPQTGTCNGCVTPPDPAAQVTELRYFRRLASAGRWAPFQYLATNSAPAIKVNNPGTINFPSNVFSQGPAGTYQLAVAVVNEYGLTNVVLGNNYTVQ